MVLSGKLVEQNEFTKTFNIETEDGIIEMYVTKAYDEDSDKHFLVSNIPEIKELGVSQIQMPIMFDSELFRNSAYDKEVNENWAKKFVGDIMAHIVEQRIAAAKVAEENK